ILNFNSAEAVVFFVLQHPHLGVYSTFVITNLQQNCLFLVASFEEPRCIGHHRPLHPGFMD
ncbi:hypothetical protein, partial [Segatella oulorum]|uniref:hypothetical protein n=1 Tax=Segatella oulorum TaxID=28136 RepID=UPI0036095DF6